LEIEMIAAHAREFELFAELDLGNPLWPVAFGSSFEALADFMIGGYCGLSAAEVCLVGKDDQEAWRCADSGLQTISSAIVFRSDGSSARQ
jgi:hypothetical protein